MEPVASQLDAFERQSTSAQCVDHSVRGALADVSIVIPIAANDESWRSLILDLAAVGTEAEWLLVAAQAKPRNFDSLVAEIGALSAARWLVTSPGRAEQMNCGAKLSRRRFLWFLHADSRIGPSAVGALERSLQLHPDAIQYFDLEFQHDGPRLARLNAFGARLRSRWLGLPFGDQGLCLRRDSFWRLGGFDEAAPYGEDHLLIWAARRARIPLHPVGAVIATSARKYASNGWLATTALHGWRTWRQAIPQFIQLGWDRRQ